MDRDGSNVRRLTHDLGYAGGAFFSPDGARIVYRASRPTDPAEIAEYRRLLEQQLIRPGALDIWVMDADGSNKRRIVRNGATNWAPSWHPDGKRIIFSSNMDDWREELKTYGHNFELYLVNLDGTVLEDLCNRLTVDDGIHHRAGGLQHQQRDQPGRDGNDVAQVGGNSCFTSQGAAPGNHGSVGSQGQTVETAGGDGHNICQVHRYVRLAETVITPCRHRSIASQGQTGGITCRDCHHAGQVYRENHLTLQTKVAPLQHCSILLEGEIEIVPGRNGQQVGGRGFHDGIVNVADNAVFRIGWRDHDLGMCLQAGFKRHGRLDQLQAALATYREALPIPSLDAEADNFLYRFSDPTFVMTQALLRGIGQNRGVMAGRVLDLCGGSGHVTRVLDSLRPTPAWTASTWSAANRPGS